jgi:biopolymer transport protein ExbB
VTLNALTQSIARLKPALTAVLVCAPSLAVWLDQATAGEPSVAVAELPQDLSPWGMFLHADRIVKAVMIGLAVASLVTWTVWVAKSIELLGAREGAARPTHAR